MIKKVFLTILIIFNILAVVYLVSPVPTLPDLENSVKSDLPGDTIQIANISGYFTNLSRPDVINFYKKNYSSFFRINLNHPPEKAKEVIVDTIQSYYLEELVLPFKESLYINGFEWEKDVFTKPEKRMKNKIFYQDQQYSSKITIRRFPVSIFNRLFTFFITETGIIFAFFVYKKAIKRNV